MYNMKMVIVKRRNM